MSYHVISPMNNKNSTLAIMSSMLFPHHPEGTFTKRRRVNLQTLPGAWVDSDIEEGVKEESEDINIWHTAEESLAVQGEIRLCQEEIEITSQQESANQQELSEDIDNRDQLQNIIYLPDASPSNNIDLLKQAIDHLRKEKEKLEETDIMVKKSIQIVAKKRLIAKAKRSKTYSVEDESEGSDNEEEEEDVYIIIPHNIEPTHEEMIAAGIEGWEWVSVY
ncbi:hypothetical protein BDB01DRAFT_485151 [Pilobolus umbonatus]|nr:hypothetical protein BDB01DRAFT_485151 [Pilobolus umbonatus]